MRRCASVRWTRDAAWRGGACNHRWRGPATIGGGGLQPKVAGACNHRWRGLQPRAFSWRTRAATEANLLLTASCSLLTLSARHIFATHSLLATYLLLGSLFLTMRLARGFLDLSINLSINQSINQSICPSIFLSSTYLSIHLFIYLSIHPSIHPSISIHASVHPFMHLYI